MKKQKKIILGTMNFGVQNNLIESKEIVKAFIKCGFNEIDTAFIYNNGESEKIVGEIINSTTQSVKVATKVNPKVFGDLKRQSIINQFSISLERIDLQAVDILYIHFPDRNTGLDEIFSTCNEFYLQGKIRELGLSNHSAKMVQDICELCKRNNWLSPTVYEGMYNALARNVEDELFNVLRKNKIRFYAYNPLAGGLLSGKYLDYEKKPVEGRFYVRPNYVNRYWKKSFFENIKILNDKVGELNLTLAEASLMWLSHYSKLEFEQGDGIIIGVSKIEHLKSNINSILNDTLNPEIVHLFEKMWQNVRKDSPKYFRYYDEGI